MEFNLVYDRGTRFGFSTDADPDAYLMSLPPLVKVVVVGEHGPRLRRPVPMPADRRGPEELLDVYSRRAPMPTENSGRVFQGETFQGLGPWLPDTLQCTIRVHVKERA